MASLYLDRICAVAAVARSGVDRIVPVWVATLYCSLSLVILFRETEQEFASFIACLFLPRFAIWAALEPALWCDWSACAPPPDERQDSHACVRDPDVQLLDHSPHGWFFPRASPPLGGGGCITNLLLLQEKYIIFCRPGRRTRAGRTGLRLSDSACSSGNGWERGAKPPGGSL